MNEGNIQVRDVYHGSSSVTDTPHFHVVIATGEFLRDGSPGFVMSILSSHKPERIEKLLRRRRKESIVIIEENEYEHLTRKTIIDCGRVHVMGPNELIGLERKTPISIAVHTNIIEAVLSIKSIKPDIRRACMNARGR